MTNPILKSPQESVEYIAALFYSTDNRPLHLSVREDICFGDKWLGLGEIALKSGVLENSEEKLFLTENAVQYGFYEWKLASFDNLQNKCLELLGFNDSQNNTPDDNNKDKTRRTLEALIDVCRRMNLLFPYFDADIIASIPFHRPTTVVADTSAIEQGGVDFLVRFLCPMARLKIPAVVTMEIKNQSDRYFDLRRKSVKTPKQKLSALLEHVKSQAGQRAILRFKFNSNIEVESNPIFSDPLRYAFQNEKVDGWPDLNLSAPQRSFCDRLILETARQHITTVTPGHPVMLMTCDEGLARMALAEGIQPFFFHAGKQAELFGQVLTGTRFHPFSGEVFSIPLQNLLWELAITFGSARIETEDKSKSFEIYAIDRELNWQPFHAKDDLLRVKWSGFELDNVINASGSGPLVSDEDKEHADINVPQKDFDKKKKDKKETKSQLVKPRPKLGNLNPNTIYQFDLNILFSFISKLLEKHVVPFDCTGTLLQDNTSRTQSKYISFLQAGSFISEVSTGVQGTDSLQQLWDSLISRDIERASVLFKQVPSFSTFILELSKEGFIKIESDSSKTAFSSPTYIQIADMCGLALKIPKEAIYITNYNPDIPDFIDIAFSVYKSIRKGEDYVLTGEWLETLARVHHIHPINSRNLLNEAQASGMIERYTQGSTPDTRFDEHTFTMLDVENNKPKLMKVFIYRGDFIIPGKASVSIRLVRN